MIYLTLWIILFLGIVNRQAKIKFILFDKEKHLLFFWLCCSFIMGFRSLYVGVDTLHYYNICLAVANTPWYDIMSNWFTQSMEMGYCVLIKFLYSIYGNYFFFQLVVSMLINYLNIRFINKISKNIYIASAIYLGMGFYLQAFNITRQMLAVSIIAFAFEKLVEDRYTLFVALILVATTVHSSSLIGLILLPIYLAKRNYNSYKVFLLLIAIAAVNYSTFILYMKENFKKYYYFSQGTEYTYGLVRVVWGVILILSIILFSRSIKTIQNKKTSLACVPTEAIFERTRYLHMNIIVSLCSIIFAICYFIGTQVQYAERMGLFFAPFVVVLFDLFCETCITKKLYRQMYYMFVWLAFFTFFMLSTGGQYTYSTFF